MHERYEPACTHNLKITPTPLSTFIVQTIVFRPIPGFLQKRYKFRMWHFASFFVERCSETKKIIRNTYLCGTHISSTNWLWHMSPNILGPLMIWSTLSFQSSTSHPLNLTFKHFLLLFKPTTDSRNTGKILPTDLIYQAHN